MEKRKDFEKVWFVKNNDGKSSYFRLYCGMIATNKGQLTSRFTVIYQATFSFVSRIWKL
jgi:hypothetical protein